NVAHLSVLPTQVQKLRVFDSLFKNNHKIFPRLVMHESLRQFLVQSAKNLDIRDPAFIVGDTSQTRIVGSVLADMGFAHVFLVGSSLEEEKEALRKLQFGVNFKIVEPEK